MKPRRIVELLHGADQADIAFLDQVEERHAAADVLLGHAHDQAAVGLDQVFLGGLPVAHVPQQPLALLPILDAVGKLLARIAPTFHALGQIDLFLGSQQRHAADLFQIEADGVVDLDLAEVEIFLLNLDRFDFGIADVAKDVVIFFTRLTNLNALLEK